MKQLSRRHFAMLPAACATLPGRAAQPNAAIAKAIEAVRVAIPTAEADPLRPAYHFRPPAQWNNDPNGTIYWGGWHHLFYQHNPFDSEWGHMHWGTPAATTWFIGSICPSPFGRPSRRTKSTSSRAAPFPARTAARCCSTPASAGAIRSSGWPRPPTTI
jgi:hypothetical protein